MTPEDAALFERCMSVGGVALFPAGTAYGLACEPDDKEAVRRVYALKGMVPDRPATVMFFDVSLALEAVPEAGPRTLEALGRLLPGALTVLVENPGGRFPLVCAGAPSTLGLQVPSLTGDLEPLTEIRWPVLQTVAITPADSAACTIDQVPERVREGCDLVLDGGELTGDQPTVVDLRDYESQGAWRVLGEGAVTVAELDELL